MSPVRSGLNSGFPSIDETFAGFNIVSISPSNSYWEGLTVRFFLYSADVNLNDLSDMETRKATFDYVSLIMNAASKRFDVVSMDLTIDAGTKPTVGELVITITEKQVRNGS